MKLNNMCLFFAMVYCYWCVI